MGKKIKTIDDFWSNIHCSIRNCIYITSDDTIKITDDEKKETCGEFYCLKYLQEETKKQKYANKKSFNELVLDINMKLFHRYFSSDSTVDEKDETKHEQKQSNVLKKFCDILAGFKKFTRCEYCHQECTFLLAPLTRVCNQCEPQLLLNDEGKAMIKQLEEMVICNIQQNQLTHPFYLFYIDQRLHCVNGESLWKKYKITNTDDIQNQVFNIVNCDKIEKISTHDMQFVECCLAGHIFWKNSIIKRDLFKDFKEYDSFVQQGFFHFDDNVRQFYAIQPNGMITCFDLPRYDKQTFKDLRLQNNIFDELVQAAKDQKQKFAQITEQFYRQHIKNNKQCDLANISNYNCNIIINEQSQNKYVTQSRNCKLQLPQNFESKEDDELFVRLNLSKENILRIARLRGEENLSVESLVLHEVGVKLKPIFDNDCINLKNEYKQHKNCSDACFRIDFAPVKTASRIDFKSKTNSKRYGAHYILDVLRATFIVSTPREVVELYYFIRNKFPEDVVFVSNDFNKKNEQLHYRKLTLNVITRHPEIKSLKIISEIQITTIEWSSVQEHMHFFYNLSRIDDTNAIAKDSAKVYDIFYR